MHMKIKHWLYGGHLKIGHIDYLLYKSSTNHMIFTQGLFLDQMTPIVGVSNMIKHVLLKYLQEHVKF